MDEKSYKLKEGIHLRSLGEEALLYDQNEKMVHILNETAAKVFTLCEEGKKNKEIVEYFIGNYQISKEEAETDIQSILDQYQELKILCEV